MDTSKELSTNRPLNVISFCSGYGGIERGLNLTGTNHRVLAYVEIEAFAIANLANKMESGELDAAPIYTDLKTFPAHLFRGCVDLLTGGYPCQPFSAAGRRKGKEDPRHLWPYIREHINAIEPVQCFFENVEGHISLGLSSVISDLEEDGYDSTWGIFSASEVGAPHQRKRVYILANSSSTGRQQITRSAHEDESEHEGRSKVQTDITSSHGERHRERAMANTISERLEGHSRHGEDLSESRWLNQKSNRPTCQSGVRIEEYNWLSEPNVGRVVDGCADRVDRIRMLGNGVVPQTAAKAWRTLHER